MLHDRDLGLTVLDFLIGLRRTTKNLNEGTLDLVRRLKLETANIFNHEHTHKKGAATEVAAYDSHDKEEIGSCRSAKWLRLC